jgi:hypothetical protein
LKTEKSKISWGGLVILGLGLLPLLTEYAYFTAIKAACDSIVGHMLMSMVDRPVDGASQNYHTPIVWIVSEQAIAFMFPDAHSLVITQEILVYVTGPGYAGVVLTAHA